MELIKINIWDMNLEVVFSVVLSLFLGFILGLEREISNKWAGMRTHILVCMGSCLFTLLSIYGFPIFADPANINSMRYGDPSRVAAQILTGIGFIGGGTVLRHGNSVSGLTTAATLWVAAAIGMACACKMYNIAIFTTLLAVAVLVLIRMFEKKFIRCNLKQKVRAEVNLCVNNEHADEVYSSILKKLNNVYELNKHASTIDENITKITAIIELVDKTPVKSLYTDLSHIKNIDSIIIREINEEK